MNGVVSHNLRTAIHDPETYEAWYHTPRGRWIAQREFRLLMALLQPRPKASLLDVGCGTGHFTRRFAKAGLDVTGLEPEPHALAFARGLSRTIEYVQGSALALPFTDRSFDYCTAVTSLCFVADPAGALREMWRVARHGVVLGMLNRASLLYLVKDGRGGYAGARWDSAGAVRDWATTLQPPAAMRSGYAVFLPFGGVLARAVETVVPSFFPGGGFLAVGLHKQRP